MKCVGLDVYKRYIYGTVLDGQGRAVKRGKFPYEAEAIEAFFHDIREAEIAIEAGYCWQPIYELLVSLGYQVHLAPQPRPA